MSAALILAIAAQSLTARGNFPRKAAVVTDIDGTLFSFAGRELSAGNREALLQCIDSGIHVCLATGRIPGPWYEDLRDTQLPGLGPCVFGNGALVLDAAGKVIWECQLPKDIVSPILEYTRGGRAGGADSARLCVLAATRWDGELRYCELAPLGRTPVTDLIDRAGEPSAVVLPDLDGFDERSILKFVIWTVPGEVGWASMPDTVAAVRRALRGTGATILDNSDDVTCHAMPCHDETSTMPCHVIRP